MFLVTAVICSNTAEIFIPSMLIFPLVRMNEAFLEGAPPKTKLACHPSGWMQLHLFAEWFDHFLHSQASKQNPALLILDGHKITAKKILLLTRQEKKGSQFCAYHHTAAIVCNFLTCYSWHHLVLTYSLEIEVW